MLASSSSRPGYQQITEKLHFDFLKQVHVLLTCHAFFGCNEQTICRLQIRFRQPDSKNDKPPPGRPRITTPLEVRVILTST